MDPERETDTEDIMLISEEIDRLSIPIEERYFHSL
jgi:hypothetical protein